MSLMPTLCPSPAVSLSFTVYHTLGPHLPGTPALEHTPKVRPGVCKIKSFLRSVGAKRLTENPDQAGFSQWAHRLSLPVSTCVPMPHLHPNSIAEGFEMLKPRR